MAKFLWQRTKDRDWKLINELHMMIDSESIYAYVRRQTAPIAEANTATEPLRTMLPTRADRRAARKVGQVLADRLDHVRVSRLHYQGCVSNFKDDFSRHTELLLGLRSRGILVTVDSECWKRLNPPRQHSHIDKATSAMRRNGIPCSVNFPTAVRLFRSDRSKLLSRPDSQPPPRRQKSSH
ncbi:hypothetical protein NDN08_007337 [Rhodosorus marinus]|uniref:Uncharacterized protein n=1 Tax=Rhodosorus marinus TaxID=101924 RepID=A0AAV8UJY9_9RHOD|nr:hypothetical protein NDN08_007337 [Rhodosorus marinus]